MGEILKVSSVVEHITPVIAKKYLEANSDNPRRINQNVVAAYAQDMKAGKWFMNGEPIVFDEEGRLRNGQHRLTAIVKADVAVDILVVRGVASNINLYDMQLKRRIYQELHVINLVETAAAMVVTDCNKWGGVYPKGIIKQYILDHEQELNLAFSLVCTGGYRRKARKRDVVVGTYALLRTGYDIEELKRFFTVVNTGIPEEGWNCSAAIIYARMLDEMRSASLRSAVLKHIEALISALRDFNIGAKRMAVYRINKTDNAEALIAKVRQMDGFSD